MMMKLRSALASLFLLLSTPAFPQSVTATPSQLQLQSILNPSQTVAPTSGLNFPFASDIAWAPSSSTAITFANMGRVTLSGVSGITGTGHAGGLLGWVINNNTGTIPLMIGVEGKFENDNGGTVTVGYGNDSNLTATNGPITSYFAYPIQTSNITALITGFYGFYFPALVGVGGNTVAPTTIFAYANLEPAALTYTVGPVVGTSTAAFSLDVSTLTHLLNKSAVPVISACGTSPPAVAVGSSNGAGQFTLGTGTPTACTVTFANGYPVVAFCTVHPASNYTGTFYISAQSKTAFTVTLGTGTSGVVFNYTCGGQ